MNTIDSLNFKDADLTPLKSRLDILKEEVHTIQVEMKRLKNEKPKKSGVSRSEKSKSKKTSNPSVPALSEVQRTSLALNGLLLVSVTGSNFISKILLTFYPKL